MVSEADHGCLAAYDFDWLCAIRRRSRPLVLRRPWRAIWRCATVQPTLVLTRARGRRRMKPCISCNVVIDRGSRRRPPCDRARDRTTCRPARRERHGPGHERNRRTAWIATSPPTVSCAPTTGVFAQAVDRLTVDHIIPISRGGTHEITNLTVLSGSCIAWKRNS
jgi:5-methylcytosine-specific restriction endonuclease McrA